MWEKIKRPTHEFTDGRAKKIPLTRGKFAIVDSDKFDELNSHKWYYFKVKGSTTGYAARMIKRKVCFMHRDVCPLTYGTYVDHINRRGLDNRKANLRECLPNQNIINRPKNRGIYSSKYKGVSKENGKDKYRVSIVVNGKIQKINEINNEHQAAIIYDLWALDVYGDRVLTNFQGYVGQD